MVLKSCFLFTPLLPSLFRDAPKVVSNIRIRKSKREEEYEYDDGFDYGNEEVEESGSGGDDASAEEVGKRRMAKGKTASGTQMIGEKRVRNVIKYDPDTHERKIPMGPLRDESKIKLQKRALLIYKERHGDMLVPKLCVVPWTNEWPEEMWGLRLGARVSCLRSGILHEDYRDELVSIGFNYDRQVCGTLGHRGGGSSISKEGYDSCMMKISF
jgi:hypothetical protein